MKIQINYGDVDKSEAIETHVREKVERAMSHMADEVTRIEVHLRDDKGQGRGENDKRCTMEARMSGRQPLAVEDRGADIYNVVNATAEKLKHAVRRISEKRKDH